MFDNYGVIRRPKNIINILPAKTSNVDEPPTLQTPPPPKKKKKKKDTFNIS